MGLCADGVYRQRRPGDYHRMPKVTSVSSGCIYDFAPAWKKMPVLDRINLECGWLAHGDHLVVEEACGPLIQEYNSYSWDEKRTTPRRTGMIMR